MTNNQVGAVPDHDDLGIVEDFISKLRRKSGFREQAKLFLKGENPFSPEALSRAIRPFAQLEKRLSKVFGKPVTVDPYPEAFTADFLANAAKYNLKPIFLPGEDVGVDRPLRKWTKPEAWFYQRVQEDKVKRYGNLAPTVLRRGWYLSDFTLGVDYTDGTQIMPSDPWATLITQLRQEGKIGKYDQTPPGSRFTITHQEWEEVVIPAMTQELELAKTAEVIVRLGRAIEFNAIGNLYDRNRGQFKMWEWFADRFGDSGRLFGGGRGLGGLASVDYYWTDRRSDDVAGRPLVSFAS